MKNIKLLMIASAISVCTAASVYAQESLGRVGFAFRGGNGLNKIMVNATEYIGECPGLEQNEILGWFKDKEVPVAKKRRVRLTNLTMEDSSETTPYSDREYKKKDKSEKVKFDFGDDHSKKKFILQPGKNHFSYIIYDNKYDSDKMKIVKEGEFYAQVDRSVSVENRGIKWSATPRFVCLDRNGNAIYNLSIDDEGCTLPVAQPVGKCGRKTVYGTPKPMMKKKA